MEVSSPLSLRLFLVPMSEVSMDSTGTSSGVLLGFGFGHFFLHGFRSG